MESLFQKYDDHIRCLLCPHECRISTGKTGICGVRRNTGDTIELLTYGVISGCSPDPIEKKPLYHFFPGGRILSIGSYGCNMRCDFCQNWQISQHRLHNYSGGTTPEGILSEVLACRDNIGLAFTYNEPVVGFEFMRDTAELVKESGFKTVLVSNGYVNPAPLRQITGFIDAFNIDLKAFSDRFYRNLTGAELEPVKEALKIIAKKGKHLEVTTLVIPGMNDDPDEMYLQTKWIAGELGPDTPFHLSRYYPMYKRDEPSTPIETLNQLYEVASVNLRNVYVGNTPTHEHQETRCICGTLVTQRSGYNVKLQNLDSSGRCNSCGTTVYSHFTY